MIVLFINNSHLLTVIIFPSPCSIQLRQSINLISDWMNGKANGPVNTHCLLSFNFTSIHIKRSELSELVELKWRAARYFTRHEINQSFIQLHEWIGLIWLQLPPCAGSFLFMLPPFHLHSISSFHSQFMSPLLLLSLIPSISLNVN